MIDESADCRHEVTGLVEIANWSMGCNRSLRSIMPLTHELPAFRIFNHPLDTLSCLMLSPSQRPSALPCPFCFHGIQNPMTSRDLATESIKPGRAKTNRTLTWLRRIRPPKARTKAMRLPITARSTKPTSQRIKETPMEKSSSGSVAAQSTKFGLETLY